jgi:hypothetical protein
MATFERLQSASKRCTIITRETADPYGIRIVGDDSSTLRIHAFPFSAIGVVTAGADWNWTGSYLITGRDRGGRVAYVGESGNLKERLPAHSDDKKSFAVEVFVVSHRDGRIAKPDAIHWQKCLSDLVEEAGVARLIKGVSACKANITPERAAELDRMLAGALPLFVDAGCHVLTRGLEPAAAEIVETTAADSGVNDDADDSGPMEIGTMAVPTGTGEQQLAYGDLWARGSAYQGRFVVAAGSEMRKGTTASVESHIVDRRKELIGREVLVAIPGVDDRSRLNRPVAFPTLAMAAKVLTGSDVGKSNWRPLPAATPVIIAGQGAAE